MNRLRLLLLSLATGALLAACDVNPQPLPPYTGGGNGEQSDANPNDNTGGGRDGAPPAPNDAATDSGLGGDDGSKNEPEAGSDAATDAPSDSQPASTDGGDASDGGEGWDATVE